MRQKFQLVVIYHLELDTESLFTFANIFLALCYKQLYNDGRHLFTTIQSLKGDLMKSSFIAGLSELPQDNFLFVLAKSENSGTDSCDFPAVEQSLLAFWHSSGVLKISSSGSAGWLSDENLIEVDQPETRGLGFFGYLDLNTSTGDMHDEIYYIAQLPFEVPSFSFAILTYSTIEAI